MSTNLNIKPKKVRDAASQLDQGADDLEGTVRVLGEIIGEIESSWKSRYTDSYLECLYATRRALLKIIDGIEDTSDTLDDIADTVERAEEEINRIMQNGGNSGSHSSGSFGGSSGGHRF